ncbi:solute carrier organic anion transporter family member 74D [Anabrus simplex]|uniref:solute carrier organic anion transporter family member 74D n=1 Tax=Anabrus simplex TaxID=316456 RepID=UPI0035A2EEC2
MDSCGLGSWFRPTWMRRFATPRWFLIVYGLLGTVQAMAVMYFIATLTTLEKRFKIPSKTLGILMSGNEVSQILLALLLTYYGGKGNRPRWIAWGVACAAMSCFILALPHAAYGAGREALALTKEYHEQYNSSNSQTVISEELCLVRDEADICDADALAGEYSIFPLFLIFLSQFVLGIGTTLYYALGQTYLDDNTKKTSTPLMLSCVMALRTVGPAFGFMLGFACLRIYIEPSLTPLIDNKDPRWLGAWWLGWVILGLLMLFLSILIAMFPKQLPRTRPVSAQSDMSQLAEEQPLSRPSLADFLPRNPDEKPPKELVIPKVVTEDGFISSLQRLLKNKLLMCNNVAAVFYILGASGYISFVTKYLEVQFQQTAAGANITGIIALFAMVAGFLISGFVISKFKPPAIYILSWNVMAGVAYVISEITFSFLGCSNTAVEGLHKAMENGQSQVINSCNLGCHCGNVKYSPVCYEELQMTFYSACHAGCTSVQSTNSSYKLFSNCTCTSIIYPTDEGVFSNETSFPSSSLISGACPSDCWTVYMIFLGMMVCMHLFGSTGKVGNILISYRCVRKEDKSFAQGLALLMVSLLAFIPGPIIYGQIIDSTCLVWDDTCKQKGNCWLYDKEIFRLYFNSTAAVLTSVGVVLDIAVCILGRSLKLYEDDEEGEEKGPKSLSTPLHVDTQ